MTRAKIFHLFSFILFRDGDANWAIIFRRRFLPGLVVVILATFTNGICHRLGMFEKWESSDSDKLLRNVFPPSRVLQVVLVLIQDEDYRSPLFHNQSPLKAAPVLDMVSAICRFHPKAVAVDILTGEWSSEETERAKQKLAELTASNCHAIWIRDAEESHTSGSEESRDNTYFRLGRVVGRDGPPPNLCTALPVFFPDSDGIVRRYQGYVAASPPGDEEARIGPYITLPGALTSLGLCGYVYSVDGPGYAPQKIRFAGNRQMLKLPARQVIDTLHESAGTFTNQIESRVHDSVVIVGGGYRQARDRYLTPVGSLLGAEIVANAVQTAVNPIRDVGLLSLLAAELGVEIPLLALVTSLNLRLPWALTLSGCFAILAAFLISWSLFNYGGYFFGIMGATVGVVLGIIGEVVYEPVVEDLKLWNEKFAALIKSEDC